MKIIIIILAIASALGVGVTNFLIQSKYNLNRKLLGTVLDLLSVILGGGVGLFMLSLLS